MDLLGPGVWNTFKNLIRFAHDTFNQDNIILYKRISGIDRWGEDNPTSQFAEIELKVLMQYNYFHGWPVNQDQTAGVLDKQSVVALFNRAYLNSLGLLDNNGNFKLTPGEDYFVHRGQKHSIEGDSLISQAYNDPLLVMVILSRSATESGTPRNNDQNPSQDPVLENYT